VGSSPSFRKRRTCKLCSTVDKRMCCVRFGNRNFVRFGKRNFVVVVLSEVVRGVLIVDVGRGWRRSHGVLLWLLPGHSLGSLQHHCTSREARLSAAARTCLSDFLCLNFQSVLVTQVPLINGFTGLAGLQGSQLSIRAPGLLIGSNRNPSENECTNAKRMRKRMSKRMRKRM
jgi:hypothetical protein